MARQDGTPGWHARRKEIVGCRPIAATGRQAGKAIDHNESFCLGSFYLVAAAAQGGISMAGMQCALQAAITMLFGGPLVAVKE